MHDADRLDELSRRHLWRHWATPDAGSTTIVRGDGARVWDSRGNEYLDGLAGLFVVQVGHGRPALAAAAARQATDLGYFPVWGMGHPPAIELAARLAAAAPGDLNRVFFTTGGSEAVESAWKLARQYHAARGEPRRHKVIARQNSYHGTTLGALSITGIPAMRAPFEPLVPSGAHAATSNRFRCDLCAHADSCTLSCADDIERMILREGPETVAAVFAEPLQNGGGCIPPTDGYHQRVREICDRYGVLLVADEVITAYGRLGHLFASSRYGYVPDMITSAKGLTSGYSPLGAVLVSDRIADAFLTAGDAFTHGITFGGHPVSCAVALANLDLIESEGLCQRVLDNEAIFEKTLDDLRDLPVVGDVRGAGYFWAVELVADDADTPLNAAQVEVAKTDLAAALLSRGLIARVVPRGDLHLQVSPALVCGPDEFTEMRDIMRAALVASMPAIRAAR